MTKTLLCIHLLTLIACSNHTTNNSSPIKSEAQHTSTETPNTNAFSSDSLALPKPELIKIYTQAIAEYIKAVNKEYKIKFDTLFFGKRKFGQPDDFPDIELPETIEHTQIRLVLPDFGLQKQKDTQLSYFINLIAWVNYEKAEFIFVTFSKNNAHQFDCFINYKSMVRNELSGDLAEFK